MRYPFQLPIVPLAGRLLGLAACLGLFFVLPGCTRLSSRASESDAAGTGPQSVFVDVADAAGLRYEWEIPGKRPLNILQTIGNGCAFLDYNDDGNLDVLLVGRKLALFQGDGKGRFEDVTGASGLANLSGHFLGCAVGDVDGDGFLDLYVSGYRTGLLLRNDGGKRFYDITAAAGLKPQPWGTSCAFAETVPGTGRLDLYVANYAVFGPEPIPQLCREAGMLTSCGPRYYKPLPGVLYRNQGALRFADITKTSGVSVSVRGRGLGVAFADLSGSGLPSLAVANDELPGDLLRPTRRGNGVVYENVAELSGTAYDRDGNVHGGMGTDWGDYDNDGRLDLFVATFRNETKSLYHNDGDGAFSDQSMPTGVAAVTNPYVAFGSKFLDYDNDGWLDLAIANGHVQDNIAKIDTAATYRQVTQLLRNKGGSPATFEDATRLIGGGGERPVVGRGLATGDYDNDGRVDLLVVDSEGKPLLLHNEVRSPGHWLGIRLVGTKSNRDGYGAVVTVQAGGRTLVRHCHADGSYLSSSDPRVHFGLGEAAAADSVTVRWPSGRTDTFKNLAADRYFTLREADTSLKE